MELDTKVCFSIGCIDLPALDLTRVVLFSLPTWEIAFSSIRTSDKRTAVVRLMCDTENDPAEDTYTGLVRPSTRPDLPSRSQIPVPQRAPSHEGQPKAELGKADERSGKTKNKINRSCSVP